MKLALVGDWLGSDGVGGGGVARVMRSLASGYEDLGVEVVVVYPRRRGLRSVRSRSLVPFGCPLGPQSILYWSVNAWDLRRQLGPLRPDAIHLHGAAAWGAFIRQDLIFTAHGQLGAAVRTQGAMGRALGGVVSGLERKAASRFRVLTAQSRQAGTMFFGRDFEVVSNPIYEGFFGPAQRVVASGTSLKAIVVGRVSPEKGVIDSIRWFKEHAPLNWELVVVGPRAATKYYEQCVERTVEPGPVARIVNPSSQDEVIEVMLKADVLLLPSHEENSPLVVAESLAIGLPVIANDVGAVKSMLDGVPGCILLNRFDDLRREDLWDIVAADRHDLEMRETRRRLARKYEAREIARQFLNLLISD